MTSKSVLYILFLNLFCNRLSDKDAKQGLKAAPGLLIRVSGAVLLVYI